MRFWFFLLLPLSLFALHYEKRGPVHILTIDAQNHTFQIGLAQDDGLGVETVSSMAKRSGAVAAINGGFFEDVGGPYIGASAGSLKIDHTYFSTCRKNRGVIGWNTSHDPVIDRLILKAQVNGLFVDKLNGARQIEDVILFSWPFHRQTLTEAGGIEYTISQDGLITHVSDEGNAAIPENGYVLSVGPKAHFPGFTIGEKVTVTLHPDDKKWSDRANIMDGTPVLIRKGQIVNDYSDEQVRESFITKKDPRSCVGLKKNGDWVFVTVEGRSGTDSGMTLKALTDLMAGLGCVDALNLDGGGSATLVYQNRVINTPSDKTHNNQPRERAVANCILVFPKKESFD